MGDEARFDEDAVLGRAALAEGLLTPRQLEDALSKRRSSSGDGRPLRLATVLIREKLLTDEQVRKLSSASGIAFSSGATASRPAKPQLPSKSSGRATPPGPRIGPLRRPPIASTPNAAPRAPTPSGKIPRPPTGRVSREGSGPPATGRTVVPGARPATGRKGASEAQTELFPAGLGRPPSGRKSTPLVPAEPPAPLGLDEVAMPSTVASPVSPMTTEPYDTERARRAAALEAMPVLVPGAMFGPYKLEREIGRGGMGVIFSSRQEDGQPVAVKVMRDPGKASLIERFVRETKAVARLDHPNIVKLLDEGKAGDLPYYVMELVDGKPFDELLESGDLSLKQRVQIIRDVARAAAFAHERGVVHRDLKPANVIVRNDGVPKVTDFGLAKLEDEGKLTRTGAAVGTPGYMSPEQVLGKTADKRSDVWALGVILYEAVERRRPFIGTDAQEFQTAILTLPPPQPVHDPGLARIMLRALEKDPRQRYQTCEELAQDLDAWIEGRSVSGAGRRGLARRVARWALSSRSVVAVSLVAIAAASLGFVAFGRITVKSGATLRVSMFPNKKLSKERLKALEPLSRFLETTTGRAVEVTIGDTYKDTADTIASGNCAIAQLGGAAYLTAKEREPNLIPLVRRDVDAHYHTLFLANPSSGITKLEDLRNRRFAFSDPLSASGYTMPAAMLLDAGLHPRDTFSNVQFVGSHDEVVLAVGKGLVDAGACGEQAYYTMLNAGKVSIESIRIIAMSPEYADDLWIASPALDPEVRERIRRGFLALDGGIGQDSIVLRALNTQRFVPAADAEEETLKQRWLLLKSRDLFPGRPKP